MPRIKIPTDWNGEDWTCIPVEWPNSIEWLALLRGFVGTPARGRFWDERTGSILDAQAIGLDIEERNNIVACDDIVIALQGIQAAVENIDVSSSSQASVQADINVSVQALTTIVNDVIANQTLQLVASSQAVAVSQSSAYAWSRAFAEATAPVTIINNVNLQFRPYNPSTDIPPTTFEQGETGLTAVAQTATDIERCKRAYWLYQNSLKLYQYMVEGRKNIYGSILSIAGLIADGLSTAAIQSPGEVKMILVPASVLLQVAHIMGELQEQNFLTDALDEVVAWMIDAKQDIICMLYDGQRFDDATDVIWNGLKVDFEGFSGTALYTGLLKIVFNYSTLGALYWTSDLQSSLPPIPPPDTAICDVCEE